MKKIIVGFLVVVSLLSGCCVRLSKPDGAYRNWYKAHAIGNIEDDDKKECVVYVVKIDGKYYYATIDGSGYNANYHIGPEVPNEEMNRHKERLDF